MRTNIGKHLYESRVMNFKEIYNEKDRDIVNARYE